jgi:ABC-type phosphate transport system auxiliary subunit
MTTYETTLEELLEQVRISLGYAERIGELEAERDALAYDLGDATDALEASSRALENECKASRARIQELAERVAKVIDRLVGERDSAREALELSEIHRLETLTELESEQEQHLAKCQELERIRTIAEARGLELERRQASYDRRSVLLSQLDRRELRSSELGRARTTALGQSGPNRRKGPRRSSDR